MKFKFYFLAVLLGLLAGINHLAAQNVVLTYQGRVTDGGSDFNGAGQFEFALVTGTNLNLQATATANLNGPFVTSYSIVSGGSGYVSAPVITISGGGGSGATAVAVITGGVVTAINPVNAGSGYTSAPIVALSPPPPNVEYTTYWSNDGTSAAGSQPASGVNVAVSNGLFTIVLGDTTIPNMNSINASIFAHSNLQLKIWFNDGANGWQALDPAQSLTPTPYAVVAQSAATLVGSLPASQVSGVVSNAQLANSFVTVTAGTGLSGGGDIPLGGSATLNNAGLLSIDGDEDITATTFNGVVTLGSTATDTNATNGIVKRDAFGNFSASTITLYGTLSFSNAMKNTAVGLNALANNTTGTDNTALGYYSLYSNSNGYHNTAVGYLALAANSNGYENVATGSYALYANTNGFGNTAFGWSALSANTSGSGNSANGDLALWANTTGSNNAANGAYALYYNKTGNSNVASGFDAMYESETGSFNVVEGASALYNNLNGSYNTALGAFALFNNTDGINNIALGYASGTNIHSGANNIEIGNAGGVNDNNIIRIGTAGVQSSAYIAGISGTTLPVGAPVYVNSSGQLGMVTSSKRFKENIQSMGDASDLLFSLHPVTFRYKPELDPAGSPQFGLVAEEVNDVDPDLVLRDKNNQIYSVRYEAVNAMLLNEFLKEHRKIEAQQTEIQELKEKAARVDSLEKRLDSLEHALLK